MPKKSLSAVDTAWLRMEDPTNLMMITGIMIFGAPIDFERLKATFQHDLLRFDRFRQRPVPPLLPGGKFRWEADPDFDIDYHLQRATLPPPGDQAALQELASLMASEQLDSTRPLWQFHLVEGYGAGSDGLTTGGCALICRLHHSIGDGLALVHVLLSLTTTEPDTPWPIIEPEGRRKRRPRSLGKLARSTFKMTGKAAGTMLHQCRETRADPSRIADAAKLGVRGVAALGRLVFLWPDPKTVFKGPLGVPKRVAWSGPLPLPDVKMVGQSLGGTINDVLLTAMSGALRRYLQGRDEPVDGLNFRAVVPVNLRRPGTEDDLGNKFGLFFLSLPVGIANPAKRLHELKRRMDALKGSLEAPAAFGILSTIGRVPEVVQDLVVSIFGMKGTGVMTNVIGPQEQIYLAGAPLESLMFWVPQSGHLGLGVSILSYNGQVRMGVITDKELVPDPDAIIAGFHAEFDALVDLAHKAKETPKIGEIAARLDEALATLDALVEEKSVADAAAAPPAALQHCQALTKAGQPCKNRPLEGSNYCRVHQK